MFLRFAVNKTVINGLKHTTLLFIIFFDFPEMLITMKNAKKKENDEKIEKGEPTGGGNKDTSSVLAKPTTTTSAHAVTTSDHCAEKKFLDRTQSHQ